MRRHIRRHFLFIKTILPGAADGNFLFLLLIFSVLYFGFPARLYLWDSLAYADAIERNFFTAIWFTNPHHLLFPLLGYSVFVLMKSLGLGLRAVSALQLLNALFGVLGIMVFYLFARSFFKRPASALFSVCILGFSYGYWYSAVSGEAYAGSGFFLICSFFLLYSLLKNPGMKLSILSGVSCGLAALFQQVNLLLLPIAFMAMLFSEKNQRPRVRYFISHALITFIVVFTAYLFVVFFVLKMRDIPQIYKWLTGYGKDYFYLGRDNFLRICWGQYRAVFGGYFLKKMMLEARSPYLSFVLVLYIVANTGLLILCFSCLRRLKNLFAKHKNAFILIFLWMSVYFSFFLFYEPGTLKFHTMNLIPLAVCAGICFDSLSGQRTSFRKALFWGSAFLVFSANFFGSILYHRDIRNNDEYAYAEFIYSKTAPGDLLLFPYAESNLNLYLSYYWRDERKVMIPAVALRNPEVFDNEIRDSLHRGRKVFLISEGKKLSSETFFRLFKSASDYSSSGEGALKSFFRTHNYRIEEVYLYEKKHNVYTGNRIFRIKRGTNEHNKDSTDNLRP